MPIRFIEVKKEGEPVTPRWYSWDRWECYKAGFFDRQPKDCTKEEGEEIYKEFLGNSAKFEASLRRVIDEWPISCAQNLSKEGTNRIAWLGQASVCIELGIPSVCRGGFRKLPIAKQRRANLLALAYLNVWLCARGENPVGLREVIRGVE